MTNEYRAVPAGTYEKRPVFQGQWREPGGDWCTALNGNDEPIAYTTEAYAIAGAKVCAEMDRARMIRQAGLEAVAKALNL